MKEEATGRVALPYLAAWRRKKFVTQRGLAAASGVSANTINGLEHGHTRANYATVGKLAKGLGLTLDQLVNTDPFPDEERADQTEEGEDRGAA